MGTHKHGAAKGPVLDHQDAEWGLQVRLLGQVLGVGREELGLWRPGEEERQRQRRTENNAAQSALAAQLCHSPTVSCLVSD